MLKGKLLSKLRIKYKKRKTEVCYVIKCRFSSLTIIHQTMRTLHNLNLPLVWWPQRHWRHPAPWSLSLHKIKICSLYTSPNPVTQICQRTKDVRQLETWSGQKVHTHEVRTSFIVKPKSKCPNLLSQQASGPDQVWKSTKTKSGLDPFDFRLVHSLNILCSGNISWSACWEIDLRLSPTRRRINNHSLVRLSD